MNTRNIEWDVIEREGNWWTAAGGSSVTFTGALSAAENATDGTRARAIDVRRRVRIDMSRAQA